MKSTAFWRFQPKRARTAEQNTGGSPSSCAIALLSSSRSAALPQKFSLGSSAEVVDATQELDAFVEALSMPECSVIGLGSVHPSDCGSVDPAEACRYLKDTHEDC